MDTKENVLSVSLAERWKKYRAEIRTCRDEFSEEAVHDLRVATRRLLAAMDVLRSLDPHSRVQKVRRALKDQLDSLDDLRDTQVMLVEVSESMADFPELKPFEEHLLRREKKLLRRARKDIESLAISGLRKRIEKSRESLEKNAPDEDLRVRLLSVGDQAYAMAMQAFGQIDPAAPASIHQFRIAFRKLRYTVEIVHPILENYPEAYLQQMHDYQSRMGDIQDATVFLSTLSEYVEETDSSTLLAPVRDAFENRRTELIAKFMDAKDELHRFWREAPDSKLPWEKNHEPVHHSTRNRRGTGDTRVRRRQPAPVDRQGEKENGKDRAGPEKPGSGN
jgi:CHAD domain-containing protein